MALRGKHKDEEFGVGDRIRVTQKILEKGKKRPHSFGGIVIGIKGRGVGKTFTVRRIGVQQIGIERIFPLASPSIQKIEVLKGGVRGVRRAKLYYIRGKSRREIEKIYSKAAGRQGSKKAKVKVAKKRVPKPKVKVKGRVPKKLD